MHISTARARVLSQWPLLGLVLVALMLSGCGIRLDLPPEPAPVPEGQDAVRQEAAQAVDAIAVAARQAGSTEHDDGDDESLPPVLAAVAADAEAHLQALGGVWEPPPRPGDEEADGQVSRPGADPAGPQQVLTLLEAGAPQLRTAAADVDADLATLLVSISTNQTVHARDLRAVLGLEAIEEPQAPEDPDPAQVGMEATALVRILDAGGYVAEVRAGRASGEEADHMASQAQRLRERAELIAVRGQFAATQDDPRDVAYALDPDDLAGQSEELARARVAAWLQMVGPASQQDRDRIAIQVVLQALDSYGEDVPVPTFPGRDS